MAKKEKGKYFEDEYGRLCMLQNEVPLPNLTANLKENFIDFNPDKVRVNEWEPILGALKVNNSLKFIAVRSHWRNTEEYDEGDQKKSIPKKKLPPIASNELKVKLSRVLKDCLFSSTCLQCLILQNMLLTQQCLNYLAKGVAKSTSLKYLSLECCVIGDKNFSSIIPAIKKSVSLLAINFTQCCLTWPAAQEIASVIKYQAAQRNGEAWKDSLRYRRPDVNKLHGLQRITLSLNSIGDTGARILADVLKDELWLKAIDLQQCGISTDGATILKESITYNKSLVVLDLRRNSLIEYDLLRSIIQQVMINAGGEHPEFPWQQQEKHKTQTKRTPRFNVCRKNKLARSRRRDSTDCIQSESAEHYPWRTAQRTKRNRYRAKNPLNYTLSEPYTAMKAFHQSKKSELEKVNSSLFPIKRSYKDVSNVCVLPTASRHATVDPVIEDDEYFDDDDDEENGNDVTRPAGKVNEASLLLVVNRLQKGVLRYKEMYENEKSLRLASDDRTRELRKENNELKERLNYLSAKEKDETSSPLKSLNVKGNGGSLDDENVLEAIESSFLQFQQFLDMLKDMGLGDLYEKMKTSVESEQKDPAT